MPERPLPTDRELEILKILWDDGQGTVRSVYEALRKDLPIVQNTVQAFLRTMEDKGLVRHRVDGRTFIYEPVIRRDDTTRHMASQLLDRVFDGAVDQLVQSLLSSRRPSAAELSKIEALVAQAKSGKKSSRNAKQN